MAFNDIRYWASILESREQDRKNWDEACEAAESSYSQMLQEEYDDLDQPSVDMETLGLNNPAFKDKPEWEEDLDETIDFSSYGVCEADEREPMTAVAKALDRTVSTANLVGQDAAVLNEDKEDILERIAAALEKLAGNNKAESSDDEETSNDEEVSDDEESSDDETSDELDDETLNEMIAEAENAANFAPAFPFTPEDREKIDNMPVDDALAVLRKVAARPGIKPDARKELTDEIADLERMTKDPSGKTADEVQKADVADDYPISDEQWSKILALPKGEQAAVLKKVIDSNPGISEKAKKNLQDDLNQTMADIKREIRDQQYLSRAIQLQKLSYRRELTDDEKKEFLDIVNNNLDDDQKEILVNAPYLTGLAGKYRTKVFLNPKYLHRANSASSSGDPDDDEQLDAELARLDDQIARGGGYKFKAKKPGEYDYVPSNEEPGWKDYEFDPDAVGTVQRRRELRHDIEDVSKTTKDYYDRKIAGQDVPQDRAQAADAAISRATDGEGNVDFLKNDIRDFIKVLNGIPKAERDELRRELIDAAETQGEKDMIAAIWSGEAGKMLSKSETNAKMGVGTDQGGKTGAGTEHADKWLNEIVLELCRFLNVADNECQIMASNLRSEKESSREARKSVIGSMIQEICDELGLDINVPKYEQREFSRAGGAAKMKWKIRLADKKRLPLIVSQCIATIMADPSYSAEEKEQLKNSFGTFQANSQVRKFKSGLSGTMTDAGTNDEYQELIAKERDHAESMTPADTTRLWQLEFMRHGEAEDTALQAAEEITDHPDQTSYSEQTNAILTRTFGQNIWKHGALTQRTSNLMKRFLRGGSGNANI